ncbi:hypothetical protein QBZ16_003151 [Prototheca wickerhamii]|uniref:RanBP2-type domain-containing protein n=1 Tax=Prototheca wickerhamii TaxID=3111 RepID=A0AAD9IJ26_PROWI|nr:hypothetical protein QBZ16_003151 [Prototheca wickerhamii]
MCQSHCFASRDTCFRCGASKLPQSAPPPGAYGAFPFPGSAPAGPYGGPVTMAAVAPVYYMRPPPPRLEGGYGDAVAWGRGPIQDGNYPQRFEVFEYQPHDTVLHLIHNPPAMDSGAPGMGAAPGHSSSKPFRQGDWNCPKCQAHNFASRMACFRCGASKVHDA